MPGMSLRTSVSAGASFNPVVPTVARNATAPNGRPSISQRAYGISGGTLVGKPHAAIGSVGFGIFSLAALVFIWWSLPR